MIKEVVTYAVGTFGYGQIPKWLYALIVAIGAILLPIQAVIHTMIILVMLDNITGIMADAREKGIPVSMFKIDFWRNIKSSKLGKSISKLLAYILLIIGSFLIDEYILSFTEHFVTNVIAVSISFREIVSILENTEKISGKSLISSIIGFVRNGFRKTFADQLEEEHKKGKGK